MPFALTIGVPHDTFMHLVPNELRAYYKSYKQKQRIRDEEMWTWWGNYGISALIVAINSCFSKNPKAEYIKEPLMSKAFGLTEEELQEREMKKAILAEEQWIMASKNNGLPETII